MLASTQLLVTEHAIVCNSDEKAMTNSTEILLLSCLALETHFPNLVTEQVREDLASTSCLVVNKGGGGGQRRPMQGTGPTWDSIVPRFSLFLNDPGGYFVLNFLTKINLLLSPPHNYML